MIVNHIGSIIYPVKDPAARGIFISPIAFTITLRQIRYSNLKKKSCNVALILRSLFQMIISKANP